MIEVDRTSMAPPRSRTTPLGKLLRQARARLRLGQREFGAVAGVSARAISRWENGIVEPPQAKAARVLAVVRRDARDLHDELARALGFELAPPRPPPVAVDDAPTDADEEAPTVARVPALPAGPSRPSDADLRAELDAFLFAHAEDRDVLPRHLREFGVALLELASRRGLGAHQAAELLAVPARGKKLGAPASGS